MRATFHCDLQQQGTLLQHVWSACVGSGHAPLALRADWQAQLRRCRDELGIQQIRFHGILADDLSTLTVQQDENVYSFFNADQIYDFLLSIGVRPFVELSFMPLALASGGKTVFKYAGNVTPPADYGAWAELIRRFVQHLVDRYGADEVRQWHFEVWNEPNLHHFWSGSQDDYFKLYRYTVEAIKGVDSELRVGGPATAQNEWVDDLLAFCDRENLPVDFVSTHHYPTDAFGNENDDTEEQLAKGTRNVLLEQVQNARSQAGDKPLFYTEWNTSSNPFFWRHDTPYAAAFMAKTFLDVAASVDGYSYWTFSDIFEENYFSSVPFHGGFGLLTIHGIAKPTYRAVQLLHRLGTERLLVDGLHPTVDCCVVRKEEATARSVTVLLTNHALPEHPIEDVTVEIQLDGPPGVPTAVVERIDANHANARRVWEEMGEPDYLSADQVDTLHRASCFGTEELPVEYRDGTAILSLDLPAHGVAAVTMQLSAQE